MAVLLPSCASKQPDHFDLAISAAMLQMLTEPQEVSNEAQ